MTITMTLIKKGTAFILLLLSVLTVLANDPPKLLDDDIIVFQGGVKDPQNNDIYIIEMGAYKDLFKDESVGGGEFHISLNRPKGASANYPVSIYPEVSGGSIGAMEGFFGEVFGKPIIFQPGETTKQVRLILTNVEYQEFFGDATLYISFSKASRTKTECSLIEVRFKNSETDSSRPPSGLSPSYEMNQAFGRIRTVGQYVQIMHYYGWFNEVRKEQTLKLSECRINHNDYAVAVTDTIEAVCREISLQPREIGLKSNISTYLYKLTEEALITGFEDKISKEKETRIRLTFNSIEGLIDAKENKEVIINEPKSKIADEALRENFYLPPRFGTIRANKAEYSEYEPVTLTIPFLNAKLYQKRYNLDQKDLLRNFRLLVANDTILSNSMTYDPNSENITAIFNAPKLEDSSPKTFCAEMLVKLKYDYELQFIHPYGAYCAFKVNNNQLTNFVAASSIDISGFPEDNRTFLNQEYQLNYKVNSDAATFRICKWESSDTTIAEISDDGILKIKNHFGASKVSISLISSEVAYRADKKMPNNDAVLKKSIELIIQGYEPSLGTQESYPFEGTDLWMQIRHNFAQGDQPDDKYCWFLDSDSQATVEFSHANSAYAQIAQKLTIDKNDKGYKSGYFYCVVPFDEINFPRSISKININGDAEPTCKVNFSIPLKNKNGEKFVLEQFFYVIIEAPQKKTLKIIKEFPQHIFDNGELVESKIEIKYIKKKDEFCNIFLETIIEGELNTREQCWPNRGTILEWLEIKENHEEYGPGAGIYDAIITLKHAPKPTALKQLRREMRYNIMLSGVPGNLFITKEIVSNDLEYTNITYSGKYGDYHEKPIADWEEQGLELAKFKPFSEQEHSNFDDEATLLNCQMPIKSFKFDYPWEWGDVVIEAKEMPEAAGSWKAKLRAKSYGPRKQINFPFKGGEYKVTFSWPKTKGENIELTYKFDDLRDKFHLLAAMPFFYPDRGPLTVEYRNHEHKIVSKTAKCENRAVLIYEPKGIPSEIRISQTDLKGRLNVGECQENEALIGGGVNEGEIVLESPEWSTLGLKRAMYYNPNSTSVRLIDEEGKSITKGVRINYVPIERYWRDFTTNDFDVHPKYGDYGGMITIPEPDGSFLIKYLPDYYIWHAYEIIADGYENSFVGVFSAWSDKSKPVFVLKKKRDKGIRAVSGVYLQEKTKAQRVVLNDLTNKPLSSISAINNSLSPLLDIFLLATEYPDIDKLTLEVKQGDQGGTISLKPHRTKIYKPDDFHRHIQNEYVHLQYKLKDILRYQEIGEMALKYCDSILVTELPQVMRTDLSIKELQKDRTDSISIPSPVFSANEVNQTADLGKSGKMFEKFNITMPSTLPFTFQVKVVDDEIFIRAFASYNFIPGTQLSDLSSLVNDFESTFKECMNTVQRSKDKKGMNTLSPGYASAFVGVKGYLEGKGSYNAEKKRVEFVLNSGGLSVEASGEVRASYSFVIGSVAFELSGIAAAGVSLERPSEADLQRAVNGAKFNVSIESELGLSLSASAQAGPDIYIAAAVVGVRGSASASVRNKVVFKPYLPNAKSERKAGTIIELAASMELYAKFSFLWKRWYKSYTIFDGGGEFLFPNNNTNPYYAVKRSKSSSIRKSYKKLKSNLPNSIIKDIDGSAKPLYINGGKSLIFNNIKNASDYNDDRIQVYNAGSSVDIDQLAEYASYNFDAVSTADNITLVAYEQNSKKIASEEEDNLDVLSEAANLRMVAKINKGNEWITEFLSEDDFANVAPITAISKDGSNAAVIWKNGKFERIATESDDLAYTINGNLMLARYNGANWSTHTLMDINRKNSLHSYQTAMDGDSIVIVAAREIENDSLKRNDIVIFFVNKDNELRTIETGIKGSNPQIKRLGEGYIISVLKAPTVEKIPSDETIIVDRTVSRGKADSVLIQQRPEIYLMSVDKNGLISNKISGNIALSNVVMSNYKLIADESAKAIEDLYLVWDEVNVENEITETQLCAGRLGITDNNLIYSSSPERVLKIPADHWISSFDAHKSDKGLKVATLLANDDLGAVVLEDDISFTNKVQCLYQLYSPEEVIPANRLPIEFLIRNAGVVPIKEIEVKIAEEVKTYTLKDALLPGRSMPVEGLCIVPTDLKESVNYQISVLFSDGLKKEINNSINFSVLDIKTSLLSISEDDKKSSVIIKVINESPFELTENYEVYLGLYEDAFGKKLYPGTKLEKVAIKDLCNLEAGVLENTAATVSFTVDRVKSVTSAFAILKLKNTTVITRSGSAEAQEVYNQAKRNTFTMLTLFPKNLTDSDDSTTNYYNLTIPKVEGLSLTPAEGIHKVKEGESRTIVVTALENYSIENIILKANDSVIQYTHNFGNEIHYLISDIGEDVIITIENVTATGISDLKKDDLKLYVEPGHLVIEQKNIENQRTDDVYVYGLNGALMHKQKLQGIKTKIALLQGTYVVAIGEKYFKIIIY